jgi:16S rRNA (uracil1498-N3)-methyltransferase
MRRFFVSQKSLVHDVALLSEAESHHIASVLRMQSGDQVELFDGSGTIYHGELQHVSRDQVSVRLISSIKEHLIPARPLSLFQGLLKGKKMDFLVQKATELGVHSLQPVRTRYNGNHGNPERQQERWHRIMMEACKQCKRPQPLDIRPPVLLDQVEVSRFSTRLFLWEGETETSLDASLLQEEGPVCLLLGPEGGFHPEEVEWAGKRGFQSTSLGRRTLRAETASLTAVVIVQFLLGGLSRP